MMIHPQCWPWAHTSKSALHTLRIRTTLIRTNLCDIRIRIHGSEWTSRINRRVWHEGQNR